MTLEQSVAQHYAARNMAEEIFAKINKDQITIDDLAPYDEFHLGGRPATEHFVKQLGLKAGMNVLDIGCGVGGAARYAAKTTSAHVTGLDLTPEFCETAEELTRRTGLQDLVIIIQGSALSLPFDDAQFDAALTIHAGMNIADKDTLYREARRVLKPGSVFGIYEILAGPETGNFLFPAPWSSVPETSFLITPEELEDCLAENDFEILRRENCRDFALESMDKNPRAANDPSRKFANLKANLEAELCAPWEFICKVRT